ncbi:MFS transporter [Nonomuraea sp. NPDC049625]|uniref:MFS transporter n=1 Tax=Nonomuraea sp. NPDC049625 TaxID=3155775 RepID=UPI0034257D92
MLLLSAGLVCLLPALSKGGGWGWASGLFLLPATVAMVVFAPLSGALNRRFGARLPLVTGILMATSSFALLAVAHDAAWHILTAVTLMGIGIGLASAAMTNAILATVPPSRTSVATSIDTLARTIGTAVLAAAGSAATTCLPKPNAPPPDRSPSTSATATRSKRSPRHAVGRTPWIFDRRPSHRNLMRSPSGNVWWRVVSRRSAGSRATSR